jgi:hypothetical protein
VVPFFPPHGNDPKIRIRRSRARIRGNDFPERRFRTGQIAAPQRLFTLGEPCLRIFASMRAGGGGARLPRNAHTRADQEKHGNARDKSYTTS